MSITALIPTLPIAALLYLVLSLYALTRPPNYTTRFLFILTAGLAAWTTAYHAELEATTLDAKLAWLRMQFLVLPFLSVIWLMLCMELSGFSRRIPVIAWRLLLVPPLVTLLLSQTLGKHSVLCHGFWFDKAAPLQPLQFHQGLWGHLHSLYAAVLQVAGLAALVAAFRRAHPAAMRKPLLLLLLLGGSTIAADLLYTFAPALTHGYNPAPLLQLPVALLLLFAVFRFQLLDVAPAARNLLFDHTLDGVVVTDSAGRLADLNPAARDQLGALGATARLQPGLDPSRLPPPWPEVFCPDNHAVWPFHFPADDADRWLERVRVPICQGDVPCGWIYILRDVTHQKQTHEREIEAIHSRAELKRQQQWALLLRDLHDGIGGIASNIGLLASLARRADSPAKVGEYLALIGELAAEGNVEVRTMMNALEARDMPWPDLFTHIQRYAALLLEPRRIHLSFTVAGVPSDVLETAEGMSLFRIVKEALTNVAKHAQATAVEVTFSFSEHDVTFVVRDNGHWQTGRPHGRGLRHIRQRVSDLQGAFTLETAPATVLTCVIPRPDRSRTPTPPPRPPPC